MIYVIIVKTWVHGRSETIPPFFIIHLKLVYNIAFNIGLVFVTQKTLLTTKKLFPRTLQSYILT